MTTPELISRVLAVVRGGEFDEDIEILPLLNEGLMLCARDFNLPSLIRNTTVSFVIGGATAPLPIDYYHSPYSVENVTYGGRIKVHTSSHSLYRIFDNLDVQGVITDVAVDGVNMVVRPVAGSDQDISISYYAKPELLLNDDTSSPVDLPDYLHQILVNYAAKVLFDQIEDGVDGAKVNTSRYEKLFMEGLAQLRDHVKHSPIFTPYIKRHVHFI